LQDACGLLLDASRPARPNMRVQTPATGLGRVTPDFPAGVAAPLSNPPRVNAAIHAWLDRGPLDVAEATLAAGCAGMYVVEVRLPAIVNAGPATCISTRTDTRATACASGWSRRRRAVTRDRRIPLAHLTRAAQKDSPSRDGDRAVDAWRCTGS